MGRILGIDFGAKRLGLALSDETGRLARPLAVYERVNTETDYAFLQELIARESVTQIVLGLPTNMDGSLGPQAYETLAFKTDLEARFKISVELYDERLTTAEAERVLIGADVSRAQRKRLKDKLAAVLILQGYLDAQRP
jgi:putative Holliday junction resolvase